MLRQLGRRGSALKSYVPLAINEQQQAQVALVSLLQLANVQNYASHAANQSSTEPQASEPSSGYISRSGPSFLHRQASITVPRRWRSLRRGTTGHLLQRMINLVEDPNTSPADAHTEFMNHVQSALDAASQRGGIVPHTMRPPLEAWKLNFKCMSATGSSPETMLVLIRQMIKEFGMPPQVLPYLSVLRRCGQISDGKLAWSVVREMESQELALTFPVIGHAVEATMRSKDTNYTVKLFEHLKDVPVASEQMDIYANLALEGSRLFSRMHRYEDCFKLLEHTRLSTQVRSKILNQVIHRASVEGEHKVLVRCIRYLRALQAEASAASQRLLLKEKYLLMALRSAEANQDLELARGIWELMQQNLITDDEAETCSPAPAPTATEEESCQESEEPMFLSPAQRKRKEPRAPSLSSFRAYITTLGRAAEAQEALSIVMELCQAYPFAIEVTVTQKRLPAVVDAIARSPKKVDAAYYTLEKWMQEGKPVNVALFNLIINACSQLGDLGRAFQTFEQLPSLGLTPTAGTFNALLAGCVATNNQPAFDAVMQSMRESSIQPDPMTLHLAVDRHVVSGDCAAMVNALTELDAAGVNPEAWLLERCVARLEREGAKGELESLLHRLKRATGPGGWRKSMERAVAWEKRWKAVEVEGGGIGLITGSRRWESRADIKMEPRGKKP